MATAVLATLIAVEQDTTWAPTHLVGSVERLYDQISIRLGRHRPAHHSATEQVQYCGEVMPFALRPDIGNVATPNRIGGLDSELPIQNVRSGRSTVDFL